MKRCIAMLILLLALASLSSTYAIAASGGMNSNNSIIAATENPVILKNEVLLNRDSINYTEMRHIILRGTNEQIGKALGEIAMEDYNASLYSYADPIYAKARLAYMQKNYPIFYERMVGLAEAYNVSLNSTELDLSILPYDVGSLLGCSMIYFPPSITSNGHAMSCRNLDYYAAPWEVILGRTNTSSQPSAYSRSFVLELYPIDGYSSLVVGSGDLMSPYITQGFNSQGLAIDEQVDLNGSTTTTLVPVDRNSGISAWIAERMILDTCKNIDEAKMVLLNNRIYFGPEGVHFMIYDKYGNSTIAEFSPEDDSVHFTDGPDSLRIMTNHQVAKYPIIDTFPKLDASISYYDSFMRYKTLTNITSNHKGKFTPQDMVDALGSVNAELTYKSMKLRTLTNLLLDLTNSTVSARFYLRDGPTDPVIGGPTNIFSRFFNFTLEKAPA
ncbi:MAG: C45 family autoproteolytic acyltransferase/hydrolase [Methanotrichaceae archaeon]